MCVICTMCLSLTFLMQSRIELPMSPDRIYHQMGVAIRVRRKTLALTQHTLAARLGISRAALTNIETGRQNAFVHRLYPLPAALYRNPHDLLPLSTDLQPAAAAH